MTSTPKKGSPLPRRHGAAPHVAADDPQSRLRPAHARAVDPAQPPPRRAAPELPVPAKLREDGSCFVRARRGRSRLAFTDRNNREIHMASDVNGDRRARLRHRNERPHERDPRRESRRDPQRLPPRRSERPVLDQAIAINGQLRVKLLGLNLLPIQVRLLVSSKEVATELGLDWWRKQRDGSQRRKATKRKST